MVNELKQSQLARIVVPAITDAEYSTGLADAFDKINDNFKKIASLPFLQGVQGDSYQLEEYPIWEKDTTENWILTEDGKILLDSIFGIDTTRDGNSFNDIRVCIGQIMPEENGVSPIDFFKNGNDIINNSLYFYVIKDDTGNIIEKQLGQYYYFVDGRLKEVGNIYNSENAGSVLSVFNDYTGFYQYRYNPKSYNQKYLKVEILPSIYYDQNKNDICWKFNGNETGISAIGVKGADGKDADLSIVKVDLNNESGVYSSSPTSGKVIGILNTSANNGETAQWITDVKYFKTGKALIYMSGNIPIEIPGENTINPLSGETETTETTINDFAYGEIVKQNDEYIAYWEPNCVFSKMLINNAFAKYFYNMGSVSYTNNAPYFLAIPSIQNRDSSTEEAKQHAHIIKGYAGNKDNNIESLNIFHSDNAFDEVGNQQINATVSNSDKALNIKNYDVNILKTLTTKGKITGESGLEVVGPAEFGGNLTVNGALGVTEASAFSNDLTVSGALGVVENAIFNSDLSVGNDLTVSGALGVEGDVEFSNDLSVGGTTILNGETTINNNLNIITSFSEEAIFTIGGATIQGDVHIKQNNPGTSTGALTVDKKITGNDRLEIKKGATITGGSFIVDTDVYNFSIETSGYGISCDDLGSMNINTNELTIDGDVDMSNYLRVAGGLGVEGIATFNNNLSINGTVNIGNTTDSTSKNNGALVVKGGVGISKNLYTDGLNTNSLTVNSSLTVNGNSAVINGVEIANNKVKASSGFFQTSDARLKNIIEPISVDLDKLSKLRKVYFKWKDNSYSNNEIGMIAQDVQKIYPELVYEDGGHLSLAYDKLSVIALEAIDVLNEKNNELEKRINKLESIILK